MQTIDEALNRLQHSKFRSSFHLHEKERAYVRIKGMDHIVITDYNKFAEAVNVLLK